MEKGWKYIVGSSTSETSVVSNADETIFITQSYHSSDKNVNRNISIVFVPESYVNKKSKTIGIGFATNKI